MAFYDGEILPLVLTPRAGARVRLLAHQYKTSSGMPLDRCRLLGVLKRVYRRVGNELGAEHRGRETPKVDPRVSKLLSQLRDSAWAVWANDSNRVERLGDVEAQLSSCGDFPIVLQRRDESNAFPRLLWSTPNARRRNQRRAGHGEA